MKRIFQDQSPEERINSLKEHAEKAQPNFSWTKKLTEVDLENYRELFAEKNIELSHMKDELKSHNQIAKAEMKPVEERIKKLQDAIEHREETIVETVYLLDNQHTQEMEYYNKDGQCVYTRALKAEERQFSILPKQKLE